MTTFRSLLAQYTLPELWAYLRFRNHPDQPIRAENNYHGYQSVYAELLALPPSKCEGVLQCELSLNEDKCGAPEAYFSCDWLCFDDDTLYALDFMDWGRLIDFSVDEGALNRYGCLVVAAELLWEITFYGFSSPKVENELENLLDLVDDLTAEEKFEESNDESDDESDEESDEESDDEEKQQYCSLEIDAVAWLANAPTSVKNLLLGAMKNQMVRNKDNKDLPEEVLLAHLRQIIEDSDCAHKNYLKTAEGLLQTMVQTLDVDAMLFLAETLVG